MFVSYAVFRSLMCNILGISDPDPLVVVSYSVLDPTLNYFKFPGHVAWIRSVMKKIQGIGSAKKTNGYVTLVLCGYLFTP